MSPVRAMVRATEYSVAHPYRVLGVALTLAVLGLGLAVGLLELRTSNLDLIDEELPPVRRFLDFSDRCGTPSMLVLVFADADPEQLALAIDRSAPLLRQAPGVDALGVSVGLTGLPKYAVDDKEVIQRDIARLSLVALGLIIVIFLLSFRSLARPLLAAVALVVAALWTLGLVSLYPGHLTLLSAFFASILFGMTFNPLNVMALPVILGLAIDDSVHMAHRLRAEGGDLQRCLRGTGQTITVTTATTVAAFGMLALTSHRGLASFATLLAMGVSLAGLLTVTVTPRLARLATRGATDRSSR